MPRCACASEVYGSVFVCVCVDYFSCSRINEVQVRVSLQDFSHVFYCEIILCSRVTSSFAYLDRRVCSKTCPWSVATLLSS